MLKEVRELLKTSAENNLNVLDFSKRCKIQDDNGSTVQYNPNSFHIQKFYLEAVSQEKYREFILLAPTQIGKTVVGIYMPVIFSLFVLNNPTIIAMPDENIASKLYITKLAPMITDAGYGEYMPDKGVGARAGSSVRGTFRMKNGANLTFLGGGRNNESAQSGITAKWIFYDEIDSIPDGVVERIAERAASFGNKARFFYSSTIKNDDGKSKILGLYKNSIGYRFYYACPKCGKYQLMDWEQVRYDNSSVLTAYDSARYECKYCKKHLTELDRIEMIGRHKVVANGQKIDKDGNITGQEIKTNIFGIYWNALEVPLARGNLGVLCQKHFKAIESLNAGDDSKIKQFERDTLVREYKPKETKQTTSHKLNRSQLSYIASLNKYSIINEYPALQIRNDGGVWRSEGKRYETEIPNQVKVITAGIDIQQGGQEYSPRLYYLIMGWNEELNESWDLSWGEILSGPLETHALKDDTVEAFQMFLEKYTEIINNNKLQSGYIGIDCQFLPEAAYEMKEMHDDCLLVRGIDHEMAAKPYDQPGWFYNKNSVACIPVNSARKAVQATLLKTSGKNSGHIPKGLEEWDFLIKHYCATIEIVDDKNKRRWSESTKDRQYHKEWFNRHDYLDCRIYNYVMSKIYKG
jgi:hypothetical protein